VASTLSSAVTNAAGATDGVEQKIGMSSGSFGQDLFGGVLSGVVNKGASKLLGDNRTQSWDSVGEDAFGNALGNAAVARLAAPPQASTSNLENAIEAKGGFFKAIPYNADAGSDASGSQFSDSYMQRVVADSTNSVALAYENGRSNRGTLDDRLPPTARSTDGGGLGGLAQALTGIPAPLVNGVAGAIGDVVNTGNIGGSVTYQVGSAQVSSSASYNLYTGTLNLGNSWLNTPQLQPWQSGYEQQMSGNDPQVNGSTPLYLSAADNALPTVADALPPIQLGSVVTSMAIDDGGLGGLSSLGVPDAITHVTDGTLDSFLKNAESFMDAGRQGIVSFGYSHGGQLGGAISQSVTDMLGFDEGVLVAGAKTISGTLQLLNNVAEVTSPLEWARDPSGNLNRLQTAYGAFNTLDSVIDPVRVVLNPQLAWANGTAILKGGTQDFRDDLAGRDYSKFAGRLAGTLGSFWVGGEAGSVAKVGRAAEVVKASQEAEILEGVEGGVPDTISPPNLTERGTLTNLRPQDISVSERPIRTLVKDDSGRYWLRSAGGNKITPSGSYDFVTMPDGTIRVARPNNTWDFSTHLGLSGGGEVNWAGSIRFGNNMGPNRGTILEWTNNSGHYQPPAYLRGNAGLPDDLFRPH
jgi:hypothetical protein